MQRETMEYDVAIVGAGPAGLGAAIRLKQLKPDLRVCVLEKGSEVGAHILSGAVIDPVALSALIPDWKERGAPLTNAVTRDEFLLLTQKRGFRLPPPPSMRNEGCYIASLANLCRWLAKEAEGLGVEIFPGFPAVDVLTEGEKIAGVVTGDFGRDKEGTEKPGFQPGVEIRAAYTLFAEGCRGSLSERLMERFSLRAECDPQSYGIGIKEIWEVEPPKHARGKVVHSVGWPLDAETYGGAFIYHMENNQVAIGLIVGLDYRNPYLDPYLEFQRFKSHPAIRPLLEGGRRVAYGARALNEGGLQAVPALAFPGGALIGCAAGFVNVARIKGSHTALASGMLAAEAIAAGDLDEYPEMLRESWITRELHEARNLRPAFHKWGLWGGLAYAAVDAYLFRGRAPWTLRTRTPDHAGLKTLAAAKPIAYPKPDGVVTFDRLSSVYLSATNHEENQPCHLVLKDAAVPVEYNLPRYGAPEQRYCPAGVYEMVKEAPSAGGASPEPRLMGRAAARTGGNYKLQINAQNCVHCKTCDIKDPTQNIRWVPPEGGGGPNYGEM